MTQDVLHLIGLVALLIFIYSLAKLVMGDK